MTKNVPDWTKNLQQVGSELRKMSEFILQEAREKAREIMTRADEEAEREKAAIIRSEKAAIEAEYAKKYKQLERSDQVARSRARRKARFEVGFAKGRVVDDVFEETRGRLKELSGDKEYPQIVKKLVLQGLYKFRQTSKVRTRPQDVETAKKAVEEAIKEYKEKTGDDIEVSVDESEPLPKDRWVPCFASPPDGIPDCFALGILTGSFSPGGVVITCQDGKVSMDNTFTRRLELLGEESMPKVIETLFGKNPNRKFYN